MSVQQKRYVHLIIAILILAFNLLLSVVYIFLTLLVSLVFQQYFADFARVQNEV